MAQRLIKLRIDESKMEWLSSFVLAFLSLAAEVFSAYASQQLKMVPIVENLRLTHGFASLTVLLVLLVFRRRSSQALTIASYLAVILPLFPLAYLHHTECVRLLCTGSVFGGQTLIFLALSVLVPGPYWINVALMLGFTFQVIAMWFFSDANSHALFALSAEPWITIIFGMVAGVLLAFRYYYQLVSRGLAMQKARTELLGGISQIFLSIRDLANTPLQSLGIAAELLKNDKMPRQQIIEHITNSIHRLNALNGIFKFYEDRIRWNGQELMNEEQISSWLKNLESNVDGKKG